MMQWTAELPTVDGWYWWKRGGENAKVVHLYKDYVRTTDDGAMVDTIFHRFYGGEWLGPITPEQLVG